MKCQDFDKWDEDSHRVQLEERAIPEDMKLCHYMWLDSKGTRAYVYISYMCLVATAISLDGFLLPPLIGFVKHLKRKAGHPIEKLECWATFPARKIVNLVMDSPADDVVINLIAQWSITSGADMVVTDDEVQTQVWLWLELTSSM
jgi:hypothetical protein